jgi:hypothetical protein
LSISSPGFQKSSPGFVKHESGFFSSPGPGFSRVRIFFESESGFRSMPSYGGRFSLGANPNRNYSLPLTDHKECCYCPSSENWRTWRKPTTFDRTLADSFHTSVMCRQQESNRRSVRGDNYKHYKYLSSLNNYRKPKQELRRLAIIKVGLVTLATSITYETEGRANHSLLNIKGRLAYKVCKFGHFIAWVSGHISHAGGSHLNKAILCSGFFELRKQSYIFVS